MEATGKTTSHTKILEIYANEKALLSRSFKNKLSSSVHQNKNFCLEKT